MAVHMGINGNRFDPFAKLLSESLQADRVEQLSSGWFASVRFQSWELLMPLARGREDRASVLAMRPTRPTMSRTAQRWHRSTLDVLRSLIRKVARRWHSSQCSELGLSRTILIPVRKRTLSQRFASPIRAHKITP